ncbi:MAG: GH3 auxin-responsive promoter family protein [Dehalococcoidia bacterium]
MLPEDKYFETEDESKIWERYCGFLDLSVADFMHIQRRLLMEQMELVSDSPLAREIMAGKKPKSLDEFRNSIPLTTYNDYEQYLSEQREDVLAEKPVFWCHSAGRGGFFKWMPYTKRGSEVCIKRVMGGLMLAGAGSRGEVHIKPGMRMLLLLAPRSYTSGMLFEQLSKRFSIEFIPPQEKAEQMEFQERIEKGFEMALRTGVDGIFAIASVLGKMGESMAERAQGMRFSPGMLYPPVTLRLLRAFFQSVVAGRSIYPKDLWKAKVIFTGGTDATIYKDQIAYYWGKVPWEGYGATEAFPIAMQGWNKKWLTFIPDVAFYEFIPEEELRREKAESGYYPSTVTFDEVKPDKTYEVVLTSFYGMPLMRYRMGDLVTFKSRGDSQAGINLPQAVVKSRIGCTINIGGLTDLDEKTIWQAIANSGIKYEDWLARKEYDSNKTFLSLYLELKGDSTPPHIESMIDKHLREIDPDYRDVGDLLSQQPVKITLLSSGTFQRYYQEMQKAGTDLAHLKPPHMNASDKIIERVMHLSKVDTTRQ